MSGKIEAQGLISILTDMYKQKDSSKVKDDSFKTAFDEANSSGNGVSTQKLLEQLEADTGISIDDFSQDEQNAINKTLEALSDDSELVFNDYNDLIDISQEYYDNLVSSDVFNGTNYNVVNIDNEIVTYQNMNSTTQTQSSNNTTAANNISNTQSGETQNDSSNDSSGYTAVEGKRYACGDKGYAQLVSNGSGYKMQICLNSGYVIDTRDLTASEYEKFGLENPNPQVEPFDDGSGATSGSSGANGSNGTAGAGGSSGSTGASGGVDGSSGGAVDSQDGTPAGADDVIPGTTRSGTTQQEALQLQSELEQKKAQMTPVQQDQIANLEQLFAQANKEEGVFGKFAGWCKNTLDTKYSAKNIQNEINNLIMKGSQFSEADYNRVMEMVKKYNEKSGGGANKAGNVAAVVGGIGGGLAAAAGAAAIIATAPVSLPALAVAGITTVVGTAGAFITGAIAKVVVKQADKATNDVSGDAWDKNDVAKDAKSGGTIGSAAYGIFKASSKVVGKAVGAVASKIGTGVSTAFKGIGKGIASAGSGVLKVANKGTKAVGSTAVKAGKAVVSTIARVGVGLFKIFKNSNPPNPPTT